MRHGVLRTGHYLKFLDWFCNLESADRQRVLLARAGAGFLYAVAPTAMPVNSEDEHLLKIAREVAAIVAKSA